MRLDGSIEHVNLENLKSLAPADRRVDMSAPELLYACKNVGVRKILFPLAIISLIVVAAFFVHTKSFGGSLVLLGLSLFGAYGVSFSLAFRFAPTNRGLFLRDSEPVRYWLSVGIPFLAFISPMIFWVVVK